MAALHQRSPRHSPRHPHTPDPEPRTTTPALSHHRLGSIYLADHPNPLWHNLSLRGPSKARRRPKPREPALRIERPSTYRLGSSGRQRCAWVGEAGARGRFRAASVAICAWAGAGFRAVLGVLGGVSRAGGMLFLRVWVGHRGGGGGTDADADADARMESVEVSDAALNGDCPLSFDKKSRRSRDADDVDRGGFHRYLEDCIEAAESVHGVADSWCGLVERYVLSRTTAVDTGLARTPPMLVVSLGWKRQSSMPRSLSAQFAWLEKAKTPPDSSSRADGEDAVSASRCSSSRKRRKVRESMKHDLAGFLGSF